MLQPIDYASAFQQQGGFLGPVSQGLQLGAQFANIDQLRALRETQANELAFRQQQAEQNAAAAASRQQRIDSIMANIQQKRQSGDLTQLDIDEAMVALPKDIADAYKNYGKSFSEEKQNYMRRVLMPIVAGKMNQERLISYLDTESSAAERSGMKEEAQNIKKIKDMISSGEQTPEGLADSAVMAVGVFPWAKDIVETYNTGKREARAAAGESRAQAEEGRKAATLKAFTPAEMRARGLVDEKGNLLPGSWGAKPGELPKRLDEEKEPLVQITNRLPELEKKERQDKGALNVEIYKNIQTKASIAARTLPALISQESILNKGFETGFGTEAIAAGAALLGRLGVPNAKEFAGNAQVFRAKLNDVVLEKQIEQKGPQTEADAKRITSIGAQLGNTVQANRFLIAIAKEQLKRDIEQRKFWDEYWRKNGTYEGVEALWEEGPGSKSLFDSPELSKFLKLDKGARQGKQTPGPASGSPALPEGFTIDKQSR